MALAARPRLRAGASAISIPFNPDMVSLHIDTGTVWRGGQRQVMYTVTGLREAGHRALLVADPKGELFTKMREGVDLVPLVVERDAHLAASWQLSRLLKQSQPAVIHTHDARAAAIASLALSIAMPTPRPPLVTSHRYDWRVVHNSFSRWVSSQIDHVVANSQATGDRLVAEHVPAENITVIYDGVDVERIQRLDTANVHAELFLPTHAPVVGSVAALVPQKGLHHLIDAASLVVHHVPDARVVIVGDGELRASLEHHVKARHLERHVFLVGPRLDTVELTKGFDVFVVSSVSEGLCPPLIDAMAAGKPAVATSVGAIPEVMVDGDTGYIVPPRDEHAMAGALSRLLEDAALRQRMGHAALRQVRERFAIERMVAETVGVYTRVVEGSMAGQVDRARGRQ